MGRYSLEKDKIRILLLEGVAQSSVEEFNKAGYTNVEYLKGSLEKEELLDAAWGAKGIGEIATIPTAPAVQNAYRALTGELRTKLPMENTWYRRSPKAQPWRR